MPDTEEDVRSRAHARDAAEVVMIDYTNYRGERRMRKVRPLTVRFDTSEWHPEQQWLLRAVDIERGATRDFAMKDIHAWKAGQFE